MAFFLGRLMLYKHHTATKRIEVTIAKTGAFENILQNSYISFS